EDGIAPSPWSRYRCDWLVESACLRSMHMLQRLVLFLGNQVQRHRRAVLLLEQRTAKRLDTDEGGPVEIRGSAPDVSDHTHEGPAHDPYPRSQQSHQLIRHPIA